MAAMFASKGCVKNVLPWLLTLRQKGKPMRLAIRGVQNLLKSQLNWLLAVKGVNTHALCSYLSEYIILGLRAFILIHPQESTI